MQKVRFIMHDSEHYNPTTTKIKNSFIKKSKMHQEKQSQQSHTTNTITLNGEPEPRKNQYHLDQQSITQPNDSPTISIHIPKKKVQPTPPFYESPEHHHHSPPQEYSFVLDRNKELQFEINRKNQKIKALDQRCEDLEMRLIARNNLSSNQSFSLNNSTNRIRLAVSSVEDKRSQMQKLKSIKQRLKSIDFTRALTLGNQSKEKRLK